MCYCDEWEFTINRADEFMVGEKATALWYVISPEELWELISLSLRNDILEVTWQSGDGRYSHVGLTGSPKRR